MYTYKIDRKKAFISQTLSNLTAKNKAIKRSSK